MAGKTSDLLSAASLDSLINTFPNGGIGGFFRTVRPDENAPRIMDATPHIMPFMKFDMKSLRPSGDPISKGWPSPALEEFQSKSRVNRTKAAPLIYYDIESDAFSTPSEIAKMQKIMDQKMQNMMAAMISGVGRSAIDAARKAEEVAQSVRMAERSFDEVDILDLPIDEMLNKARWTIGSALQEARDPQPFDSPSHVQAILSSAMNLVHMVRVMEDHVYDWNLNDRAGNTLRRATETFMEAERAHSIRYRHQDRRSRTDILANLGKRLQEDLKYTRTVEFSLREMLRNPRGERLWDNLNPGEIVDACFNAALNLEAFYEDRAFGPREESA